MLDDSVLDRLAKPAYLWMQSDVLFEQGYPNLPQVLAVIHNTTLPFRWIAVEENQEDSARYTLLENLGFQFVSRFDFRAPIEVRASAIASCSLVFTKRRDCQYRAQIVCTKFSLVELSNFLSVFCTSGEPFNPETLRKFKAQYGC